MIRLIASDIDGTLLKEGTSNLNPEYFRVIRELRKRDIWFAAGSGRGFESLENLMAPVRKEVLLMAENGAYISKSGKRLQAITFSPDLQRQIISFIRSLPNVGFCFLSTVDGSITDSADEDMIRSNEEGYNLHFHRADDILQVTSPAMKIAMYSKGDASDLAKPARERFSGTNVQIAESGAHWVDFIPEGASKGSALAALQKMLGISKEETIAFGDNNNDISMILQAGMGYAVAEAREELKAAADHVIGSYREDSVLKTILEIFPDL